MKWETLVTAPDQLTAEMWREYLLKNDVPAMLRASDASSFLGLSWFPCRLMVPVEHLPRAHELLEELREAAPLAEELEEQ